MGLLQKLWDDTLAGPTPETGLSKLRRCHSSIPSSSSSSSSPSSPVFYSHDGVPVSRSITILRNATSRSSSSDSKSTPSSPTSSSGSPFSPASSKGENRKLTRRKSILESLERAEPRSNTVYDWVVICALDR